MEISNFNYETPSIELLGQLDELTGSGVSNHDDGWDWGP